LAVKSAEEAGVMQDYLTHLEKLRKDAAECRLISDLATDLDKRELFDRLALHLTTLADQVEREMLKRKPLSG
jgi:hypothetical protein